MNKSHSSFIKALLIIAASMPSNLRLVSRETPAEKKAYYQEQFSRAVKDGPLVNTTPYQYVYGSIAIPAASEREDRLEKVSVKKALDYLDQGAEAWNGLAKCVTCHTNGSYMAYRTALTEKLGKPSEKVRQFFEVTLQEQLASPKKALLHYSAAGSRCTSRRPANSTRRQMAARQSARFWQVVDPVTQH